MLIFLNLLPRMPGYDVEAYEEGAWRQEAHQKQSEDSNQTIAT